MKRLAALLFAICSCRESPQPDSVGGRSSVKAALPEDRFDSPVVETAADAWKAVPEWKFSEQPLLVIGDTLDAANATFWEARDAALLSDGRIVFPTNLTEQRYYRADGQHLKTVGGRGGAGPGEFWQVSEISRIGGDTTVTFDGRNDRASFFSADGAYQRAISIPRSRGMFGVLDNGLLIMAVYGSGPGVDHDGTGRDTMIVLAWNERGEAVDTLGLVAGHLMTCSTGTGRCSSYATPPSLTARGKRVVYSDGDRDEIRVYENNKPLHLIRTLQPQNLPEDKRRVPSNINGRLMLDDVGNLWVYNRGLGDRPDFLIYGSSGSLIARATLPASARKGKYPKTLVDIAGDRALVLDYIELNTPVIKVYAVRRSTTPQ